MTSIVRVPDVHVLVAVTIHSGYKGAAGDVAWYVPDAVLRLHFEPVLLQIGIT